MYSDGGGGDGGGSDGGLQVGQTPESPAAGVYFGLRASRSCCLLASLINHSRSPQPPPALLHSLSFQSVTPSSIPHSLPFSQLSQSNLPSLFTLTHSVSQPATLPTLFILPALLVLSAS